MSSVAQVAATMRMVRCGSVGDASYSSMVFEDTGFPHLIRSVRSKAEFEEQFSNILPKHLFLDDVMTINVYSTFINQLYECILGKFRDLNQSR